MNTLMMCGHVAQATDGNGVECCVICDGPAARTPDATKPLAGRVARCSYYGKSVKHVGRGRSECSQCNNEKWSNPEYVEGGPRRTSCKCERPSSTDLAFFAYRGPGTKHYKGEGPHDEFYCGCFGWD